MGVSEIWEKVGCGIERESVRGGEPNMEEGQIRRGVECRELELGGSWNWRKLGMGVGGDNGRELNV